MTAKVRRIPKQTRQHIRNLLTKREEISLFADLLNPKSPAAGMTHISTVLFADTATLIRTLAMNNYMSTPSSTYSTSGLTDAPVTQHSRSTLQPMFITNKTQIEEIDTHLSTHPAGLVVVTIEHGSQRGETLVQRIGQQYPDTRIILVCEGSASDILKLVFMNGVQACVSRQSSVETLRCAIDEVIRGKRFLAPELGRSQATTVGAFMERQIMPVRDKIGDAIDTGAVELTRREKQVLALIAQGKPRRNIAELLKVSPRTIDAYRARLLQKLNLDSSVQLVKYAYSIGLIS
jgi:DNA-binding NarL/FixJ family response regulator